jgi:hypothetical protein
MFLPIDISLTMEDILEGVDTNYGSKDDCHEDHISETYDDEGPWTEKYHRKKSRKKLKFL